MQTPRIVRPRHRSCAGLISAAASLVALASVALHGAPAYVQNFNDGTAPQWTAPAGSWSVANGVLAGGSASETSLDIYSGAVWCTDYTLRASVKLSAVDAAQQAGLVYNYIDRDNYDELTVSADGGGVAHLNRKVDGVYSRDVVPAVTFTGANHALPDGTLAAGVWIDLEVVRTGTRTSVWVGGNHVFDGVDQPAVRVGRIGTTVLPGSTASFDNVSVATNPVVAYREDFSAGTDGWCPEVGATYAADAGTLLNRTATPTDFDLALYDGGDWHCDYIFRASVQTSGTGADRAAGVVFNYRNPAFYDKLTVVPSTGAVTLEEVAQHHTSVIATGQVSGLAPGLWVDIDVVRSDASTATIIINGKVVPLASGGFMKDLPLADYPGHSRIGVFASHDAARFDNVSVTTGSRWYKDGFPKVGVMAYSNGYGDPTYQQQIARYDLVVTNWYRDLGSVRHPPASLDGLLNGIRAINPTSRVGTYSQVMECGDPQRPGDADYDKWVKLNAEAGPQYKADWWERTAAGAKVTSFGGNNETNLTDFVIPDAEGRRYPQWLAQRQNETIYDLWTQKWDFIFSDNCFYKPRTNPDYNGDGVDDPLTSPLAQTWWRRGMSTYLGKVEQLNPDLPVMPNTDGDYQGNGFLHEPEYRDRVGAAFIEGALGKPWSVEVWGTWKQSIAAYAAAMANTRAPHLVAYEVQCDYTGREHYRTGSGDYIGSPSWAFLRYCLASALLNDGYVTVDFSPLATRTAVGGGAAATLGWFDEFDWYLGRALEGPVGTPDDQGLYWRHFENGISIVNPKGNGTRTVQIPEGYARLNGTQDPVRNDGSRNPIALPERDGVILRKL